MQIKKELTKEEFENKVYDIEHEPMPQGAWWWWFWLFFFNNPKETKKMQQFMILWSTKNVKKIQCNDLKVKLKPITNKKDLEGVVAAWYFDGDTMHHNFLLEQCMIKITDKMLTSESNTETSHRMNREKNIIKIGDDFEFFAQPNSGSPAPTYVSNTYIGSRGYSILRAEHFTLEGVIKNTKIEGSAYFQRIFLNAFAFPWYWGIFHFEKGEVLSYFYPHILHKPIRKTLSFYDGKMRHKLHITKIRRSNENLPSFFVSGKNEYATIDFVVRTYSHSSWTFKKKIMGLISNKLVYNEYPAVISDITFKTKDKTFSSVNLGKSIGNAEYSKGILI